MKKIIFSIVIFVSFAMASKAQVVNIEPSRMQSDTTGWMGSAGAGTALTKNTQEIFSINLNAHLQYKTAKDLWLLLGDYQLLKSGGKKFIANNFIHFRYNHTLNKWLRWEAFTQVQSNTITQIQHRFLIGTGPRFKIISKPKFRLYAASLVMYENEEEKVSPAIIHNDVRSSSYISFTFLPSPNIALTNTLFYQPLFNQLNDYRLFHQLALTVKASRHFSMSLNWNYLYDRLPAGASPRTTYNLSSGIGFSF